MFYVAVGFLKKDRSWDALFNFYRYDSEATFKRYGLPEYVIKELERYPFKSVVVSAKSIKGLSEQLRSYGAPFTHGFLKGRFAETVDTLTPDVLELIGEIDRRFALISGSQVVIDALNGRYPFTPNTWTEFKQTSRDLSNGGLRVLRFYTPSLVANEVYAIQTLLYDKLKHKALPYHYLKRLPIKRVAEIYENGKKIYTEELDYVT